MFGAGVRGDSVMEPVLFGFVVVLLCTACAVIVGAICLIFIAGAMDAITEIRKWWRE
jgi:hypothetical protein